MEKQQGRESKKDNDLFYTCSLIDYIARKTKNQLVGLKRTETREATPSYLWSGSKCWMRAHKRTFNTPRRKSQIGRSGFSGFVCFFIYRLSPIFRPPTTYV